MDNSIIDANGWSSEPDVKEQGRRKIKPKKREDKKARETNSREPPEMQEELTTSEPIMPEPDVSEETPSETDNISLVQRVELIRKQLAVKNAHDALMNALDNAIAAEKELGKQLYAIENNKKNNMAGNDIDYEAVITSANGAKMKAAEKPNMLVGDVNDKLTELESAASQAAIGRGIMSLIDGENGFNFTEDEREKIDVLRDVIEDNKEADAVFTAKAPSGMDEEEYKEEMDRYGVSPEIDDDIDDELSM